MMRKIVKTCCFICATSLQLHAHGIDTSVPAPVINFRPGHNISLLGGFHQSHWIFDNVGEVSGQKSDSWYPSVELRYAFHFNVFKKIGYFVGWSLRYAHDDNTHSSIEVGPGISFPSILVGSVLNTSSSTRLLTGFQYEAVWYRWMRVGSSDGSMVYVSPILDSASVWTGLDWFFTDRRALSLAVGWKRSWNWQLRSRSEEDRSLLLGSLYLTNQGLFAQLGLTWQLGDELDR